MNISIIGTGYVGLVSGACFAKLGHSVICVDVNQEKVDKINNGISPIFETDLDEILSDEKNDISATTSYSEAIKNSEITFICVGTPSAEDGSIDLSFVKKASEAIALELKGKDDFHCVVVKSTVVPGTTRDVVLPILEKVSGKSAGVDFGVGMNPEFLREGSAVDDFLHPDRVVNGAFDDKTKGVLNRLYSDFDCPIVETSLTAAEMIKYASNAFLATKISFINEVGNICKELLIDTYDVAEGMGLDKRIERSFLNAGIGWGGSCFPKDTLALKAWADEHGVASTLLTSVVKVNEDQPARLIHLLKKHILSLEGKTIGILGLAFKPDTDDWRESRSIPLIENLLSEGAVVKAFDPKAMEEFSEAFPNVSYCSSADEVLLADAVIIATEWEEFNNLDFSGKLVIDGRRLNRAMQTAETYEGVCW